MSIRRPSLDGRDESPGSEAVETHLRMIRPTKAGVLFLRQEKTRLSGSFSNQSHSDILSVAILAMADLPLSLQASNSAVDGVNL